MTDDTYWGVPFDKLSEREKRIVRPDSTEHEHRYDTVLEWRYDKYDTTFSRYILEPMQSAERQRATRVMCSGCMDVQEL